MAAKADTKRKYRELGLILLLVMAILWGCGVQIPFIVKGIRSQIREGMTREEVIQTVTSQVIKPDACDWEREDGAVFSSPHNLCNFPVPQSHGKVIVLTILFMGPVFNHNDFRVTFDASGHAVKVSEVRQWD